MEKLLLLPTSSRYSADNGKGALFTELDGGAGRYRRDFDTPSAEIKAQWELKQSAYEYMQVFFRHTTQRGSLPFLLELVLEDAFLTEYTCRFKPETFKLTGVRGLNHTVQATIEVEQPVPDEDYDSLYLFIFENYGGQKCDNVYVNFAKMTDALEVLVNIKLSTIDPTNKLPVAQPPPPSP